ncbi:MAG: hypothetical protein AB2693_31705, partial [Candidatus Thiodiazotropha sp.]
MAGKTVLTNLKPVALANDDYDEDLTYVKQVAQSEFSAETSINVSRAVSVPVTQYNVNELYNDIISDSQESTFQGAQACYPDSNPLEVDCIVSAVRSLPKSLCITQLLKDSSSDRDRLEAARSDIFACIKESEGFPFDLRSYLKKRIHTRSGDSVEYKLAHDIYCLAGVLDGADWDDLREVINIPRPSKKLPSQQSQPVQESSFSAYPAIDLDQLKRTVQVLSADMVSLKQENIALKSNIMTEIKSLKTDLNQLKGDCEAEQSELRSLINTNALSVDRVCNEKSNGIAHIKSELKQIKSDVKQIMEDPIFSVNTKMLEEKSGKIGSIEKRLSKMERRLHSDPSRDLVKQNCEAGDQNLHGRPYCAQDGPNTTMVYDLTGDEDEATPGIPAQNKSPPVHDLTGDEELSATNKLNSTVLKNAVGKDTLVKCKTTNLFTRIDTDQ